jgi:hypothetical protein
MQQSLRERVHQLEAAGSGNEQCLWKFVDRADSVRYNSDPGEFLGVGRTGWVDRAAVSLKRWDR